ISPYAGFLIGWAILMDYLFIPMVNFLLFGIFFSAAFPEIPMQLWILVLIVVVTYVNVKGVKVGARANMLVLSLSLLFLLIFSILSIKAIVQGTGTGMLLNIEP